MPNRARGRLVTEGEPANGAADSVRTDHDAELAGGSVAELDCDSFAFVAKLTNFDSHPNWGVASPVEQDVVEICTMKRQAGADAVPQRRQIDLDEQPAAVVADALPGDHDPSLQDRLLEAEPPQRTGGIPGQVDTRARPVPRGFAFDRLDSEASTGERSSGSKPSDATSNDENSHLGYLRGPARDRKSRIASLAAPGFSSFMRCDALAISNRSAFGRSCCRRSVSRGR